MPSHGWYGRGVNHEKNAESGTLREAQMRNLMTILVLAAAFEGLCVGQTQTALLTVEEPGLAITITGPASVTAGSKVMVSITPMNRSDHRIRFRVEPMDYRYQVTVYDAQNNMAMETERGRKVKGGSAKMSHLGGSFWLDPGESRKDQLAVSNLYDMSRPGKYKVQVSREGAKSNTITIDVVP
jgi:hypothetical protein